MGWLIRFILISLLITLLVRAVMKFFGGLVEGASGQRRQVPPAAKMVMDPVCGTYVVQNRALMASRGDETAWFCSPECQQAWQRR